MVKDVSNHNRPWNGWLTHENTEAIGRRLHALLAPARFTLVEAQGTSVKGYVPPLKIAHNCYLGTSRWNDEGEPGVTAVDRLVHIRGGRDDCRGGVMFSADNRLWMLMTSCATPALAAAQRRNSVYITFDRDRDATKIELSEEDHEGVSKRSDILIDRKAEDDREFYLPARLGGGGGEG